MARWTLGRVILSEPVAWAVQNALGVAFSTLFITVSGLRFPLACIAVVLAVVALLLMSFDRSAGGRICAALIFCATVLTGTVIGGAIVSLSFLARGSGNEPLITYLPPRMQSVGAWPQGTASELQLALSKIMARLAVTELPPELTELWDRGKELLAKPMRSYDTAFWVLQIVLTSVALIPLSVARARAQGLNVALMLISTVLLGAVVCMGFLSQGFTLEYWWRMVVLSFVYGSLAAAAASVVAGCLVFVRSAHDEVRESAAALALKAGQLVSELSSSLLAEGALPPDADASALPLGDAGDRGDLEALSARLEQLLEPLDGSKEGGPGLASIPRQLWSADCAPEVQRQWARLQRSLNMASLEPPIPGLCSQPGADLDAYRTVKVQLELLSGSVFALGAACNRGRMSDLAAAAGMPEEQQRAMRSVLAGSLGLAAAACGRIAEALAYMPALRPCSGPALNWRPVPATSWEAQRAELGSVAESLEAAYNARLAVSGPDLAVSVRSQRERALLFVLPTTAQLMRRVQTLDAAVAAALDVPMPADAPDSGPAANAETAADKAPAAAEASAPGSAADKDVEAAAGDDSAAGGPQPQRAERKRRFKPYLANAATLLAMGSGLASWLALFKGCAAALRGLPAALSSRQAFGQALRDPVNRFAFKYWFGLSASIMGCTLFTWNTPHTRGDFVKQTTEFVNWQPLYAWMATAISLQPNVESSVAKGAMRVGGIFLGAMLGMAVGLNGDLLNNAWYITGMIALLTAFFSLPGAYAELRYTLCMVCYTACAELSCVYVGCCGSVVMTDWQTMAAKAVPTAIGGVWGVLVSALLWPHYASNSMLDAQAAILRDAFAGMTSMFREAHAAALELRAPDLQPQLLSVESCNQRISAVGAQLSQERIDPRVVPYLWRVAPTPPVVDLMQPALRALVSCQMAGVYTVARVDYGRYMHPHPQPGEAGQPGRKAKAKAKAKSLQAATALAPGRYTQLWASDEQLHAGFEAMLEAYGALVQACAENLEQGRHPKGVLELRERVVAAAAAAAEARLEMQRVVDGRREELLSRVAGLPCTLGDLVYMAWLYAFMLGLDQLLLVAGTLESARAQRRDYLGGWLQMWRQLRVQK